MRLPRLDEACPALDPGMLASLREIEEAVDDDQFIAGLVGRFVDEATVRLDAIAEAVAKRDVVALGRQAHAIVNSAGAIGALRVCTAARQLDGLSRVPDGAAGLVRVLERELDAAVEACRPLRLAS